MAVYLVTGGSGFLGINLIRYLLAKGETVRSLDIAPFEYKEKDRVESFRGDIRDRSHVRTACAGVDVVIHAAAALPSYIPADIRSIDVGGTRIVLEEAFEAGASRVVHVSTTAVYGIPDHAPLTEDDPLHAFGPYSEAKIAAEKICEEFRAAGKCVPVIRPVTFIGPERLGIFGLLYSWASEGRNFPLIGSGKNRFQLLDVEDLCDVLYMAATTSPDRANHTFTVGAKDFRTMREDWQSVLDAAGFKKRIIPFPRAPITAALAVLDFFHLSPVYAWVYDIAAKDVYVSTARAERLLGFSPRFSNQQALIRNYEWYVAHRKEFSGQSGVSHRVPWKEGVLSLAKLFF